MMQKKIDKTRLSRLDIVFLVIATPIIYLGGIKLLFVPLVDAIYYPHRKIFTGIAFLIILAFDAVWVVLMRYRPLKNIPRRLKIFLTVLVLTLSAIVLSCLVIADALEKAFV